jgi:hypothetical protein
MKSFKAHYNVKFKTSHDEASHGEVQNQVRFPESCSLFLFMIHVIFSITMKLACFIVLVEVNLT